MFLQKCIIVLPLFRDGLCIDRQHMGWLTHYPPHTGMKREKKEKKKKVKSERERERERQREKEKRRRILTINEKKRRRKKGPYPDVGLWYSMHS